MFGSDLKSAYFYDVKIRDDLSYNVAVAFNQQVDFAE